MTVAPGPRRLCVSVEGQDTRLRFPPHTPAWYRVLVRVLCVRRLSPSGIRWFFSLVAFCRVSRILCGSAASPSDRSGGRHLGFPHGSRFWSDTDLCQPKHAIHCLHHRRPWLLFFRRCHRHHQGDRQPSTLAIELRSCTSSCTSSRARFRRHSSACPLGRHFN